MRTHEISVRLFAGAKDAVGAAETVVWAEEGVTAGELLALLAEEFPDAKAILAACRVAVNRTFVPSGATIPEGAEVALIPPVSGG